jgi:hypothetical protein
MFKNMASAGNSNAREMKYEYENIAELQAQAGDSIMQDTNGLMTPGMKMMIPKVETTELKTSFMHIPSHYNPQVFQWNSDIIL